MSVFGVVLLTSTLACAVTTIGIYIIGRYELWANRNAVYFMSFAAGVLISVSFVHIIPKSFEMDDTAPVFLLLGFMGLYLLNRFLNVFVWQQHECPELTTGIIPMLGIGFHSLLDGVIYSVTFNVSIFTGIVAAIGMVLHEFPEGIVTFVLLKAGRLRQTTCRSLCFPRCRPFHSTGHPPFISPHPEDKQARIGHAPCPFRRRAGLCRCLPPPTGGRKGEQALHLDIARHRYAGGYRDRVVQAIGICAR